MIDIGPLPDPEVERPRLWNEPASGDQAPWSPARDRLAAARTVWLCAIDRGRPHCRPLWSVWLAEGLAFSTGSPALRRACDGGPVSATTEDGDAPVILEGTAYRVHDHDLLERFAVAVTAKYQWPTEANAEGMVDAAGNAGPVFVVRPRVAFGWGPDMSVPTRWRF